MLRSESSSRMWIDLDGLCDRLTKGCVYSPSEKTSLRVGNEPAVFGFLILSISIGPSCEWKKGGGREATRHGSTNNDDDMMKP